MFASFSAITHALALPAPRHAMFAHFPILLAIVALGLMIAFLLTRGRSATLRTVILVLLAVGAIMARLTASAGSHAMNELELPLTEKAGELLEAHEALGGWLWVFFLPPILFTALTWLKFRLIRYPAVILSLLTTLLLNGWIARVAHEGGSLVYDHGVGVPQSPNNVESRFEDD